MADKATQQKEVESTAEEVEKSEEEEVQAEDANSENEASENGESTAEKENGKEEKDDKEEEEEEVATKVCSVKRKSAGGDATDAAAAVDGATPEKKAKLDETAEAESNGEAEVAA